MSETTSPPAGSAPTAPSINLKTLLTLAWPSVISRASQTVMGISDALLVAHLGAAALVATSTGATNSLAVLILPLGLTFIINSFSSQHFGRGDPAASRRFGWYGLILAAITQVLVLGVIPLVGVVLARAPYSPEVRELMTEFVQIRLLGAGPAVAIEALSSYFGGTSRTRPGMVANLVAMSLNVGLNFVLIDGAFGLPALGVNGSALASTLATWVAFIGFFIFFWREGRALPRFKGSTAEFIEMLRVGIPSGFNWFLEFGAFALWLNLVVASLGTTVIAALNVVLQINSVSAMPGFGIATAGSILVGQSVGSRRPDQVPAAIGLTLKAGIVWQGLVGLVYLMLPAVLLAPFARGDDQAMLIDVGVTMLRISAAWQVFDVTVNVYAESLRAVGDTVYPFVLRLLLAWGIWLAGSWLSIRVLNQGYAVAIWWVVAYLVVLSVGLVQRFKSGAWRRMQLIDGPAGAPDTSSASV